MGMILTLLMLFQLHAANPNKNAGLPDDLYVGRQLNQKYEFVRFTDTIMLPDNWCSLLFNCDVRLPLRWDQDFTSVQIRNEIIPYQDFKGTILPITPGCYGEQRQVDMKQMPFYFDGRSTEGVTIRGKAGMRIYFYCQVLALKSGSN